MKKYRTIILPVVLYGRETWLLTMREERRLRVFENRVLRRISEVTGKWRSYIYNEELLDLFSPPNIIQVIKSRRMRWTGQVAHMEVRRHACMQGFDGETWGKKTPWKILA